MQSSIAVLVSVVVMYLTQTRKKGQKSRVQPLLATTVEFQKNQCYFAGAIQIATLTFLARSIPIHPIVDLLDVTFIYTISNNGLVPIISILWLILRYDRQSWHITLLSSGIFALSTGTLAATWTFLDQMDPLLGEYDSSVSRTSKLVISNAVRSSSVCWLCYVDPTTVIQYLLVLRQTPN